MTGEPTTELSAAVAGEDAAIYAYGVLGPHLTPDDLAEHARTNAYEVMTALGRRYARTYVDRPETHQ